MRSIAIRLVTLCLIGAPLFLAGCTEMMALMGLGVGSADPSSLGTLDPNAGTGTTIANPGTSIPTTTQPAAIAAPGYNVSVLDPLLEQTAGASAVVAADMNSDGLTDFVSCSSESQPVQLHLRNSNNLEYSTRSFAGSGPLAKMIGLKVADFDQDGNPDVAVLVNDTGFTPVQGADLRGAVVLLFAPANPADNYSWTEVTIDATFILPNDSTGQIDFDVADFDGVNGPDVVLMSNEVNDIKHIYLYPNPGGGAARVGGAWNQVILQTDAVNGAVVRAADLDGDGDMDIFATFPEAKTYNCRWLRNPQREQGAAAVVAGAWPTRALGQQHGGGDFADIGDIDRDGDLDIAVASKTDALVQWFENPGPNLINVQSFPWSVFNIVVLQSGQEINQVQLVDMNLDGQLDCYVTANGSMVGAQPGSEVHDYWTPFTIMSTNPMATIGRTAFVDVNADGKLDIIAPLDREGLTQDQIAVLTRQ